jgi:hypothetical protein
MSAAVARVAESKRLIPQCAQTSARIRAIADGDALMRGNMDMRDLWVLADRIMLYYYLPPPVNEDSRGRLTLRTLYNP